MKAKFIIIAIVILSVFFFAACTEGKDDYRITSKWAGVYGCEKMRVFNNQVMDVFVDVFLTDEDSVLYVRERIVYDVNNPYIATNVQLMVKIDTDGSFASYAAKGDYVKGYIRNDSIYMGLNPNDARFEYEYKGVRLKDNW